MPLSSLPRTNNVVPVKLIHVEGIPRDCCGKQKRRPTMMTEVTYPFSDVSDDEELSHECLAEAISDDSDLEHDDDDSCDFHLSIDPSVDQQLQQQDHDELRRTPPRLLQKRRRHISRLLRKNQHALDSLMTAPPQETKSSLHHEMMSRATTKLIPHPEPSTKIKIKPSTANSNSWNDALQFEFQQSLPGLAALVIYCIAHASTYEFISNVIYEALEALKAMTTTTTANNNERNETILFTGVLLLGCFLSRFSGLAWDFIGPLSYQRVKFSYHNRLRMGAKDAVGLSWLQEHTGEATFGCLSIVSYYCVYIGAAFFVSQLALLCDQREAVLSNLPSAVYQQAAMALEHAAEERPLYMCPVRDYSPDAMFGGINASTNASEWDPMACSQRPKMLIFGVEDDQYLYRGLSKNSYDHFFGQEYETALFDSIHQIAFYSGLALLAICTLKGGFGFSFWAGW